MVKGDQTIIVTSNVLDRDSSHDKPSQVDQEEADDIEATALALATQRCLDQKDETG